VLDHLKTGYDLLKKANATSLATSIEYGKWLEVAFELHSLENLGDTMTWKEWLNENIGIQDSYARKLREMAKILGNYPRFSLLGLSFSEIYQRRKQIQSMLVLNANYAKFWRDTN